jgi:hypothetical protein
VTTDSLFAPRLCHRRLAVLAASDGALADLVAEFGRADDLHDDEKDCKKY